MLYQIFTVYIVCDFALSFSFHLYPLFLYIYIHMYFLSKQKPVEFRVLHKLVVILFHIHLTGISFDL